MTRMLTPEELEDALRKIGEALPLEPSVPHRHEERPADQAAGPGLGAQPLLLSVAHSDQRRRHPGAHAGCRLRRAWRQRIIDHDGERAGEGGIERWLKLTAGLGLDRAYVISTEGVLPATRFAVDAYVHFVRERTLLEAIASSLTEMFSPRIIADRVSGMLANYDFVSRETLAYFQRRLDQAPRDADFALDYVKHEARRWKSSWYWTRYASNAPCCGRSWTRSSTPTSLRAASRMAPFGR